MNMKEYAFGIDLGGTTAKVGLFTTAGALLEKWEVPTDTSNAGEHILGNLAKAVKDKMQENGITAEQVEGVGVGVPGPVLDSRIVPIVCANLGGWGERNVSIQLSGLLDEADFQRVYQKVKGDRAALEQRLSQIDRPDFSPERQNDLAKELVERFLATAPTNREVLVSLIERVELTEKKEIIIKFRFPEPETGT